MCPVAGVMYASEDEVSSCPSFHSDSDIDDAPMAVVKVPLREQYKSAGPHSTAAPIDWVPCRRNYMQRVAQRLKTGIPSRPLPAGFPTVVRNGPSWSTTDLKEEDIVVTLDRVALGEIDQALLGFKGLGLSKDDICPETFPLPSLAKVLDRVTHEVHDGCGLAVLRGIDPSKYTLEDNIIIYAGIASYVGRRRGKQDRTGNILVHIKDVGARVAPDNLRQSPYANNAQPFHNDLGDMIALYCIDKAATGGTSKLAPAAVVYNELAAYRPDLIDELAAPDWAFDKHDGRQMYNKRPILFRDNRNGRVFFCFSRRQLTGSTVSPRPSYLPRLTEAQAEALDAVHFIAEKHALTFHLEKGDIQFSNNLALFHAREAFTDGADSHKRHLIRMWLRNDDRAWPTPSELRDAWNEIYDDQRRSIWHMEPDHDRAHVIDRTNSCHG